MATQLKNQRIAVANPGVIANREYIDALYIEKYGRKATQAEYDRFKNSTVKDAANIILGAALSPFTTSKSTSLDLPPPPPLPNVREEVTNYVNNVTLQNPKIAQANPGVIANRAYIDALYLEKYGRKATEAEYTRFQSTSVKDASNIILGAGLSPFSSNLSATLTRDEQVENGNIKKEPTQDDLIKKALDETGVTAFVDEAFQTQVPKLTPGTPEFESAVDKIEASFFDVMKLQVTAQTEQEKALADYNYEEWKADASKTLNVTLSNNAFSAWEQLQTLKDTFNSTRNLQGSGLESESIDNYLKKVRRSDAQNRSTSSNNAESKDMEYYLKYATPQQVAELIRTKPDLAKSWGLVPSDEVKNSLSFNALKAKYPNLTTKQISDYISSVLDENGNYRSQLYQNYLMGKNTGVNEGTATYDETTGTWAVSPSDFGVKDIEAAQRRYKELNALAQNANAAAKAESEFKQPDENDMFIRETTPSNPTTPTTSTTPTPAKQTTYAYVQADGSVRTSNGQIIQPGTSGYQNALVLGGFSESEASSLNKRYSAPVTVPTSLTSSQTTTTAPKTTTTSPTPTSPTPAPAPAPSGDYVYVQKIDGSGPSRIRVSRTSPILQDPTFKVVG